MHQIEAILLDADGVLIHPAHQFARYLQRTLGLPPQRTKAFFSGPFRDCLVGRKDLKAELAPFLDEWGWTGSVDGFLRIWFEVEHCINEPLLEVVRGLRAEGYICAVATNQERYRANYISQEMGFGQLFDVLFASCDVGVIKPEPEFYRRVTEQLGLQPNQIILWDDTLGNVDAARAFGWHAEVYKGLKQIQRWAKELPHAAEP